MCMSSKSGGLVGSFVCCVCSKGRKSGDEAIATSMDNTYFTLLNV